MDHATYPGWTGPQTTGHAESFQLISQRLKLYFTGKKIPEAEKTAHILLVRVGKEGLRHFSSWVLPEEQQTPATILGSFKVQLEPQCRNVRTAGLKLIAYLQGAAYESLDDFVNRTSSAKAQASPWKKH